MHSTAFGHGLLRCERSVMSDGRPAVLSLPPFDSSVGDRWVLPHNSPSQPSNCCMWEAVRRLRVDRLSGTSATCANERCRETPPTFGLERPEYFQQVLRRSLAQVVSQQRVRPSADCVPKACGVAVCKGGRCLFSSSFVHQHSTAKVQCVTTNSNKLTIGNRPNLYKGLIPANLNVRDLLPIGPTSYLPWGPIQKYRALP